MITRPLCNANIGTAVGAKKLQNMKKSIFKNMVKFLVDYRTIDAVVDYYNGLKSSIETKAQLEQIAKNHSMENDTVFFEWLNECSLSYNGKDECSSSSNSFLYALYNVDSAYEEDSITEKEFESIRKAEYEIERKLAIHSASKR